MAAERNLNFWSSCYDRSLRVNLSNLIAVYYTAVSVSIKVVRTKCVAFSVAVQLESSRRRSSRATLASKALGRDIDISFGRHITTASQAEKICKLGIIGYYS